MQTALICFPRLPILHEIFHRLHNCQQRRMILESKLDLTNDYDLES